MRRPAPTPPLLLLTVLLAVTGCASDDIYPPGDHPEPSRTTPPRETAEPGGRPAGTPGASLLEGARSFRDAEGNLYWEVPFSLYEGMQEPGAWGRLADTLRTKYVRLDEETTGLRVLEVGEGSLLARLGFREDDVLLRLNDLPLESPEESRTLFPKLQEEMLIWVDLLREGREMSLHFTVRQP